MLQKARGTSESDLRSYEATKAVAKSRLEIFVKNVCVCQLPACIFCATTAFFANLFALEWILSAQVCPQ